MIFGIIAYNTPSLTYSHDIISFIELALSEELGDDPGMKSVITGCDDGLNDIVRSFCVNRDIPCENIHKSTRTIDDDVLTFEYSRIIESADIIIMFISRGDSLHRTIMARAAEYTKTVRLFELPVFKTNIIPSTDHFDDDTDMESLSPRDPCADVDSGFRYPEDIILLISKMISLCGYCAVIPSSCAYLNRCFDAYLNGHDIPHIFLNPETGISRVEETNRRIIARASFLLSLSPCLTAERRSLIDTAACSDTGFEFVTDCSFFVNESLKTRGMKTLDLIFMKKEYCGLAAFFYRITDRVKENGLYLVETRETSTEK